MACSSWTSRISGRGAAGKTPVFGLLKRGEKVFVTIVPDCSRETLLSIIQEKILEKSTSYTDGRRAYDGLVLNGYDHYRVFHSENEFARQESRERHRKLLELCEASPGEIQWVRVGGFRAAPQGVALQPSKRQPFGPHQTVCIRRLFRARTATLHLLKGNDAGPPPSNFPLRGKDSKKHRRKRPDFEGGKPLLGAVLRRYLVNHYLFGARMELK